MRLICGVNNVMGLFPINPLIVENIFCFCFCLGYTYYVSFVDQSNMRL